ncbi:MAG: GxxExxY protein [Bacteroidetes bacterium]|jgi:GxxExxY protein|nr:GxxExxY protein [Bacteroidota bacterium]
MEEVNEPVIGYHSFGSVNDLTYKTIGCCFDVHNELGKGFSEIVYKDALEYELKKRNINYSREKKFEIKYKDIILPHCFFADFVINDQIILEVKAQQGVIDEHIKQVLNYLAISECELGLLVNFGESSLKYKRLALTK